MAMAAKATTSGSGSAMRSSTSRQKQRTPHSAAGSTRRGARSRPVPARRSPKDDRKGMIGNVLVEGHAIVSEDGMIADARGEMPDGLRNDADWALFQAALDRSALIVLGSLGHKRHPNRGRCRLVLTHAVEALAPDPDDLLADFWNPAGMPIETVLHRLGVNEGTL